jgi:hypothetical protein
MEFKTSIESGIKKSAFFAEKQRAAVFLFDAIHLVNDQRI